ncbi:hypothetical protein MHU86_8582 [Fragilaria crotonensis]|nr:hypothetical protein MHU86_8582 [Fragilaria crotonensis]
MSNHDRFSAPVDSGLERRMELLESRFTTPSHAQPTLMVATGSSPEVATVLGSAGGSPFASHHSFGFDAPSGSHSSGSGASNTSSLSNLGKGVVRSKKKRPSSRLSTFDEMKVAAERQMQRVSAKSPLLTESSYRHASDHSNAASNQTILTSHKSSQEEGKKLRVVAESPPMLTSLLSPNLSGDGHPKPSAVKPAPVTVDKRKSVPVKRQQPSVVAAIPGRGISSPTISDPSRKRTRLNFAPDESSKSPKVLTEISSNSRSNPGKSGRKKAPGDNNRKIDHFFSTVKKHAIEASSNDSEPQPSNDSELEMLRARCDELEKILKDKDDQLKAVSNNQTITNTALKASLCQREKELVDLKRSKELDTAKASRIIENLVRVESSRAAKELRQKLASDGARLGRITYTRAGLRTVESWEEGHASKLLQRRKWI